MKKTGRKCREGKGRGRREEALPIVLLFHTKKMPWTCYLIDGESEGPETTWSSDSKGSPFLWTPTTSGSDGVMRIPPFPCIKSSVSAPCTVQIRRTGPTCRLMRATSIWSFSAMCCPAMCSTCVHWLNSCFQASWQYVPVRVHGYLFRASEEKHPCNGCWSNATRSWNVQLCESLRSYHWRDGIILFSLLNEGKLKFQLCFATECP